MSDDETWERVETSPVERLTNLLLIGFPAMSATHARVSSGRAPRMEYRISGRWERWPDAEDSGPQRSTTPVIARLREMAQLRGRGACEFGTLWLHGHAPDKPRPEPMLFRGFHLFFARTAAGEAVAITPTLPMALRDLSAHPLAPRVTEQAQQGMAAFGAGDTRGGRLAFTHATELAEGLGDAGIDLLVHALLSFAVGLNDVAREAEARVHAERALEICEREGANVTPPLHLDVLTTLGVACEGSGLWDESAAFYRRAVDVAALAYGVDNLASIHALNGLGRLELERDQPAAAMAPLQRAQHLLDELVGEKSAYLGPAVSLGRARHALGEPGARDALRAALKLAETYAEPGPVTNAAHALAVAEADRGDLAEAALRFRQALSQSPLKETPYTAEIETGLARVLLTDGRRAEALSLLQHAREVLERTRAHDHPVRVRVETELSRLREPGVPYR